MWSEIVFVVERDAVDAWSDALLEAGAASVQAEDADADSGDEAALFGEPGEPAPASGWQRTRLAALVAADTDAPALLARAAAICARPAPAAFDLREVPDQDWVQATQSQFAPIPVGRRLWITPSWHLPGGTTLAQRRRRRSMAGTQSCSTRASRSAPAAIRRPGSAWNGSTSICAAASA